MNQYLNTLKNDLDLPPELETLFNGITKADELSLLFSNKDSFVKNKLNSCSPRFEKVRPSQLLKEHFIAKESTGEISTKKSFAFIGFFQRWGITVKGLVAFEKDVIIERSTVTGPAYISQDSRIFDSHLRGTAKGAVYIGKRCNIWDYSEINRSLIGDSSKIHTCNINDSILGPDSNFGATHTLPLERNQKKNRAKHEDITKISQRTVVANYSFGNKIKILDPTTDTLVENEATHFGTVCGKGVSCASGTIIYPGTIIGKGARIASTIPLLGYIEPNQTCSFYFVLKRNKDGSNILHPKGTLAQLMKEYLHAPHR